MISGPFYRMTSDTFLVILCNKSVIILEGRARMSLRPFGRARKYFKVVQDHVALGASADA